MAWRVRAADDTLYPVAEVSAGGRGMRAVMVRAAVLSAGAGLAAGALLAGVVGPAGSVLGYRHAPPCSAAVRYSPRWDCVGHEDAVVVDAGYTDGGSSGQRYGYYVVVTRASGRTERIGADRELYRAAYRGERAGLRLWHGAVAAVSVDGVADDKGVSLPSGWIAWAVLAWLGLGLMVWAVLDEGTFEGRLFAHAVRLLVWSSQGLVTAFAVFSAITARHVVWWDIGAGAFFWSVSALVAFAGMARIESGERPVGPAPGPLS